MKKSHISIETSLNSSEEDSDHQFRLQEQNWEKYEDAAEEVEDSGRRKGKQTNESMYEGNRK